MADPARGEVTSGTMSPSLEVGIGMGYVPADLAAEARRSRSTCAAGPCRARVANKPLYVKEKVT